MKDCIKIVICVNPITKKNNQRILKNRKTGRRFIAPSERYSQFEKECAPYLLKAVRGIDYPINLKCHYYMKARYRVDITNLMSATHDVLVKYNVIKDDDSKIVKGVDGSRVLYDKNNPRTEIYISRWEDEEQ